MLYPNAGLGCQANTCVSGDETAASFSITAGQTYFIVVDARYDFESELFPSAELQPLGISLPGSALPARSTGSHLVELFSLFHPHLGLSETGLFPELSHWTLPLEGLDYEPPSPHLFPVRAEPSAPASLFQKFLVSSTGALQNFKPTPTQFSGVIGEKALFLFPMGLFGCPDFFLFVPDGLLSTFQGYLGPLLPQLGNPFLSFGKLAHLLHEASVPRQPCRWAVFAG